MLTITKGIKEGQETDKSKVDLEILSDVKQSLITYIELNPYIFAHCASINILTDITEEPMIRLNLW